MGRKPHPELSRLHAFGLMNAIAYSVHLEKRFTYQLTIHLEHIGISENSAQRFISEYFKQFTGLLRQWEAGPPLYVWVLEHPLGRGLHLHALVHVPKLKRKEKKLRSIFRERAKVDWVEALDATAGEDGVLVVRLKPRRDGAPLVDYIRGTIWFAAGYMFKGWPLHDRYGIKVNDWNKGSQGLVIGKRCGFSESLGPASRREAMWSGKERLSIFKTLDWKAPPPGEL